MNYTYLKLEDKPVLKFNIDQRVYEIQNYALLPFSLRNNIVDTRSLTNKSEHEKFNILFHNQESLAYFFYNRSLSVKRENAKYIMNQLHIKQNNDFETRYKAMILCKALSVSDSYWITNNENEKWKDVNVKSHPLHETLQQIALFGRTLTITGKIHTPELTGQGAYAKAWYRENDELFLYKASTNGGNESEREVLASKILDCFNVPHVPYELTKKEDKIVCKCPNMNLENTSIVDAIEYDTWCTKKGKDLFEESKRIDSDIFYKTIIIDYLISNADRHLANWGFFMDNNSGDIIRLHPLFDHNNAFDKNFMADPKGGECQLMPGKTQKEAALYAMKRCDFRCIKPVTKDMFFDLNMYNSFMERASELGLYQKRNVSIFEYIVNKNTDTYIPKEIKADNNQEYWNSIKNYKSPSINREQDVGINLKV